MMHPRPEHRPNVDALLAVPQIKKILRRRRLLKPFTSIVSILNQVQSLCEIKYSIQTSIVHISEKVLTEFNGPNAHTEDVHSEILFVAILVLQTEASQKTKSSA